jgi:hypothetical protein
MHCYTHQHVVVGTGGTGAGDEALTTRLGDSEGADMGLGDWLLCQQGTFRGVESGQ